MVAAMRLAVPTGAANPPINEFGRTPPPSAAADRRESPSSRTRTADPIRIILIRHGQPDIAPAPRTSHQGFGDYIDAYEAAGRVVLNQSDLLVVVWDGGGTGGVGGTLDTLRAAITFNVPAIWIDSRSPHGRRVLRRT